MMFHSTVELVVDFEVQRVEEVRYVIHLAAAVCHVVRRAVVEKGHTV